MSPVNKRKEQSATIKQNPADLPDIAIIYYLYSSGFSGRQTGNQ